MPAPPESDQYTEGTKRTEEEEEMGVEGRFFGGICPQNTSLIRATFRVRHMNLTVGAAVVEC